MNNLLIIGNGFDLAHDLPTNYPRFIEYMIEEIIKDSQKYKEIVQITPSIINSVEAFNNNFKIMSHMSFKNKFFETLYRKHKTENWSDIETLYYEELSGIGINNSKYQSPKQLNDEFKIIKKCLQEYLSIDCIQKSEIIESFKYLFNLTNKIETAILNFNYTKTLHNYLKNSKHNVINIHGELKNPKNPIIFGYAADDTESRNLIGKGNDYMENIKKHNYKRTNNIKRLIDYLDGTKNIDISILGHSCGISDKLILNQVFNHDNINSIRIFYHEKHELFFQTQVNIDRIMNNDLNFSKLLSYEDESHRCPQFSDNEEQIDSFNKYIYNLVEDQEERFKRSLPKVRSFSTN